MRVIVRPHPEYCKRYPQKMSAIQNRYSSRVGEDFEIQTDFSSNEVVFTSDLIITDWSTISYEYAYATKRPVLFIDTPMKVMNPEYEKLGIVPLDISCRNEMGLSLGLDELDKTAKTVQYLLDNAEVYRENITSLMQKTLFNIGRSAEVGGDYILQSLVRIQQNKSK